MRIKQPLQLILLNPRSARAKGIEKVSPHSDITLCFAGEDGANVGEDTVNHVGDMLEGVFESFEVAFEGDGGFGGSGFGEEVDWERNKWVGREIVMRYVRPLRSACWKRSSQGIGTKTAFSGLGWTPTGELQSQISCLVS